MTEQLLESKQSFLARQLKEGESLWICRTPFPWGTLLETFPTYLEPQAYEMAYVWFPIMFSRRLILWAFLIFTFEKLFYFLFNWNYFLKRIENRISFIFYSIKLTSCLFHEISLFQLIIIVLKSTILSFQSFSSIDHRYLFYLKNNLMRHLRFSNLLNFLIEQ